MGGTLEFIQSFNNPNRRKMTVHTKGTTGNTMMKESLLWVPQWSCQMELLFKQNIKHQSNLHTQVTY